MLEHDPIPPVVPVWLVAWIAAGASTLIGTLVSVIWNRHNKDMAAINARLDGTVKESTYEQNRREMNTAVVDLHKKIEDADKRAQDRHNDVMSALVELGKK